jgi:hypothetical protein
METRRFQAKLYLSVIYVSQSLHSGVTGLESVRKKWTWLNLRRLPGGPE